MSNKREVADSGWLCNIECVCSPIFAKKNEPPVIKPTLPELAKVDRNLNFVSLAPNYISWQDFVPRQHLRVDVLEGRRSRQA
jgi:hypothetical protein